MAGGTLWWSVAGGAVVLCGVVLLVWALFGDRAKGRRRCPKCWYDMSHTGGLRCPECGRDATRERHLFRGRRRWRWAFAAGPALLSGAYLSVHPQIQQHGWWWPVPDRGLVMAWMFMSDFDPQLWNTMVRRDSFDDGDWDRMIERCAAGDGRARPVSEDWKAKYGEIIRGVNFSWSHRHEARQQKTETAWLMIPMQVHMEVPPQWPEDVPLHVMVQVGDWWRDGTYRSTAHITPRMEGAKTTRCYGDCYVVLPPLPAGKHTLILDVRKEREKWAWAAREPESIEHMGDETREFAVNVRGTLNNHRSPLKDPALAELIRTEYAPTLEVRSQPAPYNWACWSQMTVFTRGEFEGAAIGLIIDVVCDEEVVATTHAWGRGGSESKRHGSWNGKVWEIFHAPEVDPSRLDPARWRLRLRSDPGLVMRVPGCDRYWAGEVEIPLAKSN